MGPCQAVQVWSKVRDMTTAEDLACELGISGKTFRTWLRTRHPSHVKGSPWIFTSEQAEIERAAWQEGRSTVPSGRTAMRLTRGHAPAGVSPTDDRDQAYVIDLCDEILGEVGHRETRFDWLRGDAGLTRAGAMLPVDAYHPNARLVIEYWERQHSEPIAHFDKPDRMTVSGVHRGEQRKRYDALREREIPAHDLSLIIVKYSDLDVGRQGRLRRSVSQDRMVLRRILDSR
jgi:hypothetical protein